MKPDYWQRAKRALARRDPVMARIMREHPKVFLARRGAPFLTLARAIVGQQISVKAAQTIWERFVVAVDGVGEPVRIDAGRVGRTRLPTLRRCGLSERKAEYLRDLAAHFADGRVDQARLAGMSDDQVIERLTDIRGIGRWTAEMFLIFNLLRPDVLPLDDLGLLKAVGRHYLSGRTPASLLKGEGRQQVVDLASRWVPYRSVATWYLWRSLDPIPVDY